jgi:glycosyltransferase involved in cell wall biosynthesis
MSAFADVTPMIIGDSPPPAFRNMMRLAYAKFYPRRRYRREDFARALESGGEGAAPGLWEALEEENLGAVALRLTSPDALMRHCLNPARIERLLADLRRIRPDLVYLCDTTLAILAPHVGALGVPVVVGPHNHDSVLYASMSANAPNERLRQWNALAAQAFEAAERLMAPYVAQIWACSREDGARFVSAGLAAPESIRVIPNVYELGAPTPPPEGVRDLVFVGQANYYPNEDAIRRLIEISRQLDRNNVSHRMRIVGRIGDNIRRLATAAASVEIVGEVESVLPYIDAAAIAPIALTLGGGTRLKILEAMARARPVLSTPIGIEGIDAENGVSAVIESDLSLFPERIAELLGDREKAAKIALAGWDLVRERYSHQALLKQVGAALRDLGVIQAGPTSRAQEHFQAKWTPVRVKKMRENKNLEPRFDSIKSGNALARNLGAKIVSETARYHPVTRLLDWRLEFDLAVNDDDVSAQFVSTSGDPMANAFVQVKRLKPGRVLLDATAILPAHLTPLDVRIVVRAWGQDVHVSPTPTNLVEEKAGLLTIDKAGEGIRAMAWSADGAAVFSPDDASVEVLGRSESTGAVLLQARFPSVGRSIGISHSDGAGQDFEHLAAWIGWHSPTSVRLRQLKDKHKGETAWLIGNGPSVQIEDLDRLAGRLTFCFNRFHLAHEKTLMRAAYTLTGDTQMIEDFGQQIVDESGGEVFIAHHSAPDLIGDYIWLRQAAIYPPLFSHDPGFVLSPGGSTPFVAIQLAYYMGVRKFNFYGADFSFRFDPGPAGRDAFRAARGEGNHFIANYRAGKPWCPPSLRDIGPAFFSARLLMEAEDGFIRNVTRGGALEIFERQEFDRALDMDIR